MQEESVAQLASFNLRQLQALVAKHVSVLSDPQFTQSPIAETEELIRGMDAKQAAKTSHEGTNAAKGHAIQVGHQLVHPAISLLQASEDQKALLPSPNVG